MKRADLIEWAQECEAYASGAWEDGAHLEPENRKAILGHRAAFLRLLAAQEVAG